jgi:enamine deaminase RidA (YjgF/YER057c/UK114 family)|tara:strand:+ start:232 stop:681 length:450 start_codon:yes stop_codon:yes gene_type:complete
MKIKEKTMPKTLERLHWKDAPDIWAPFIPIIKVKGGTTIYLAGTTAAPMYHHHPHRPEEFESIPDDMEGQANEIMNKIKKSLDTAGGSLKDVVSATRYLKNMQDQDILNKVWEKNFGEYRPTTTTVEISTLAAHAKLLLEVTVTAVIDE